MSEQRFRVMIAAPKGHPNLDELADKLAGALGIEKTRAERLLGSEPKVVKRNASKAQAEKLQGRIEQTGALAMVQAMSDTPAIAEAAEPAAATSPAPQGPERFSLKQFVETTEQRDRGHGLFELESDRFLEVNLDGELWIKTGVMVAYHGAIKFTREGVLEHGLKKLLKRSFTGEGTNLTKANGRGSMYLADSGKKITILKLNNESIFVNGSDLMAFEPVIDWDVRMMRKATAMLAGGLFNVELTGSGMIAITTHFDPITLRVTPDKPIMTDPNATVAWSGNLTPDLKTDVSFKTFLGRGSGESIQMLFKGDGFVVVQPFEEQPFQSAHSG